MIDRIITEARKRASAADAQDLLTRIRLNIIRLLCAQDVIELDDDPALLGGKEALGEDVAKALINLFALADKFGVDIAHHIEALLPTSPEPTNGKNSPLSDSMSVYTPPVREEQQPEMPPLKIASGAFDFQLKLEATSSIEDLETTWKEVVRSSIPATDKANLQKVKIAMTKKLKEAVIV